MGNPSQPVFTDGFGISHYRSFGEQPARTGPFTKVNLFIGQNNTGKSNILDFISSHYRDAQNAAARGSDLKLSMSDWNQTLPGGEIYLEFALRRNSQLHSKLRAKWGERSHDYRDRLDTLISSNVMGDAEVVWFRHLVRPRENPVIIAEYPGQDIIDPVLLEGILQDSGITSSDDPAENFKQVIALMSPATILIPEVTSIPAYRRIQKASNIDTEWSGAGLTTTLHELKNPKHESRADRARDREAFAMVEKFLGHILHRPEVRIHTTSGGEALFVELDGVELPIEKLGTGISELLIFMARVARESNRVICIREPELHLHPKAQRDLISFLHAETENQYFIETHSAHILDDPIGEGLSIFHVTKGAYTQTERVFTGPARVLICADLGYKPSDMVQANCVIWVEGPSDRLYINHWLKQIDNSLTEGIHYSIMIYGGGLLRHLCAEDSIEDLINLRSISQHSAIVMDRDSNSEENDEELAAFKSRIIQSYEGDLLGFAWVTWGREIENYIPASDIEAAVTRLHPKSKGLLEKSDQQFGDLLAFRGGRDKIAEANKVAVALQVIKHTPPEVKGADGELHTSLLKLVQFIRNANGQEPLPN